MTAPRVSVLLITRDHEEHVERALASVGCQALDEPVEVVVADDASSDRTLSIIAAWTERTDVDVRVLTSEQRLGAAPTVHRGFAACRGPYIAVLEADDEWTSADKLRRQVELLDRHPELSMAATRALVLERLDAVAASLREHGEATAFELLPRVYGDDYAPGMTGWLLTKVLCYLDHLEREGTVVRREGEPERWTAA